MSEAPERGNGKLMTKEGALTDHLERNIRDLAETVHDEQVNGNHPRVEDHAKQDVEQNEQDPPTASAQTSDLSAADKTPPVDQQFGQHVNALFECMK